MPSGPVRVAAAVLASVVGVVATAAAQHELGEWKQARSAILEDVTRRLQSGTPREVAWGAFLAAQHGATESIPAIVAALKALPPPRQTHDDEGSMAAAALLDAAVQLGARVPVTIAKRHWQRWPVRTTVVLANAGDDWHDLVPVLEGAKGEAWHALANVLVSRPAPGFASHLLRRVSLTLSVTVSDEGRRSPSSSGGGISVGVACGVGANPPGFPPHARYRFEGTAGFGFIVLSAGPRPVFYSRSISYDARFGVSSAEFENYNDAGPLDYLIALQGIESFRHGALKRTTGVALEWTGLAAFEAGVRCARAQVIDRYHALVSALERAGHLTEREVRGLAPPTVEVRLDDRRSNKATALRAPP